MSKPDFDPVHERLSYTIWNEDGDEETVTVPAVYAVCPRCEGRGRHVNPAVDEHGLSPEEFAEDPDFAEGYFRGDYDVDCYTCGGRRVIPVPDERRASPEALAAIREAEETEARWRAIEAAERRMGY